MMIIGGAAVAWPLAVHALQPAKVARIGTPSPLAVLWIRLAYAQKLGTDFGFSLLRR